jgi:CHAD domain-containing protein
MVQFVDKQSACAKLNLSGTTLKRYRTEGILIEGIHWVRINSRCIRYNLEMLQDWLQNRHDPAAHWRNIEAYHAQLLNNQSGKKPGRRAN